jgi:HAD superfamily hydrolase (TIGR01450 family)
VLPPAVAVDLDGVVWRATAPIAGAAEALARLTAAGVDVVYVTNNAGPTLAEHEAKLARFGIDAAGAVVASAQAAASLLAPGERALVAGGSGVAEAVVAAGAVPVSYDEAEAAVTDGTAAVDAVVVGFHQDFDYRKMAIASRAVRAGARFVATNDDATFPTEDGLVPGNGAIVAGIAAAAGVRPTVAGKPFPPIVEVVRERCGPDGLVVGDRPDTDGRLAVAMGWRFALVLSGVTAAADLPVEPVPDVVAVDLAALVEELLGSA